MFIIFHFLKNKFFYFLILVSVFWVIACEQEEQIEERKQEDIDLFYRTLDDKKLPDSIKLQEDTDNDNDRQYIYRLVLKSVPEADVKIEIAFSDNSIENLSVSPNSITFNASNWDRPQEITITLEDDEEATRSTVLMHSVTTEDIYYQAVEERSIVLIIADDDPGILLKDTNDIPLAKTLIPLRENEEAFNYKIVLNTEPTEDVVIMVNLPASAPGNLEIASGAQSLTGSNAGVNFTFTSGNWSSAQPITLTLASDSMNTTYDLEGYSVMHNSMSDDMKYEGIEIPDIKLILREERTTAPDPTDPDPDATQIVIKTGTFMPYSSSYISEGTASIISKEDAFFLILEDDFIVSDGPQLNVYLAKSEIISTIPPPGETDSFIDLGGLKETNNVNDLIEQRYPIPDGTNVSEYTHVIIHCVPFNVSFGRASLNEPSP